MHVGVVIGWMLAMGSAFAQNIDFATLPLRDAVQLTIYNAEDLTLVQERRRLVLQKGRNALQFSWANTLIDPTSVEIEFLGTEAVSVVNTRYPHTRKEVLLWEIESAEAGEVEVAIRYFTSGLRWEADYEVFLEPDRQTLTLENFVRVRNKSGEDYENAKVRVVVGTINVTEKIKDLARRGIVQEDVVSVERARREAVMEEMRMFPAPALVMPQSVAAAPSAAPKKVEKEAFGEYFLYTIEGEETIPNGWEKRLRSFKVSRVKADLQYRYRPWQYGKDLTPVLTIENTESNQLGKTPFPNGTVRVYQLGAQVPRYLGQQTLPYVPIGDKAELVLTPDPLVRLKTNTVSFKRSRLQFQITGVGVNRFLGESELRPEWNGRIVGWDEERKIVHTLINRSDFPAVIEVRQQWRGDVTLRSAVPLRLHDFETVEYKETISPKREKTIHFTVIERLERNAKQQKITFEQEL